MKDHRVDGKALRMIRIRAQRSQKDVAEQVGVTRFHLSNIENDRRIHSGKGGDCSDMLALRLADALNCEVDDFARPRARRSNSGEDEAVA
jgi:DNA-binding XRE family transcriptional regulator